MMYGSECFSRWLLSYISNITSVITDLFYMGPPLKQRYLSLRINDSSDMRFYTALI